MKTLKLKQLLATTWIVLTLAISSDIIPTQQLGFASVQTTYACGQGVGNGGGC